MSYDFHALHSHVASIPAAGPSAGEPAYPAGMLPFDLTAMGLDAWRRSPLFGRAMAIAAEHRRNSLLSDESRALLYHLIVAMKPERVLEVGTYRAGTSRLLAQALHHAGRGVLYTIDPYGIDNRAPEEISAWPAHLQLHARFFAVTSSVFFSYAQAVPLPFDLVLVDGDHEFEAATYDMGCAARIIRPSGIVVLDNVDQPGPRFATMHWLDANPEWSEMGGAVAAARSAGPLDDIAGSMPGTKFFVLRAPDDYAVSGVPRSFGSMLASNGDMSGITIRTAAAARGTLHYRAFCRAFGPGLPEELTASGSAEIDASTGQEISITFDRPLSCAAAGEHIRYRSEIILAFNGGRLRLACPPDRVSR